MSTSVEDYRYPNLDGIVLKNLPVHKCSQCPKELVEFEAMEDLLGAIALAVAGRCRPLQSKEVRFLRGYLDCSDEQFADLANIPLERWTTPFYEGENKEEMLLRLLVCFKLQRIGLPRYDVEALEIERREGRWTHAGKSE